MWSIEYITFNSVLKILRLLQDLLRISLAFVLFLKHKKAITKTWIVLCETSVNFSIYIYTNTLIYDGRYIYTYTYMVLYM